jgi:glutathione S-transferase
MKLYNAGLSPNALCVRAVANELGIELELVDVDLGDPDAKRAALSSVNPNLKVPVLVDGDFVLWESRAIAGYLASLRPGAGLYPADARQRAIVDQWTYWHAVHLGPAMQAVNFQRGLKPRFGMGEPDERAIAPQLKETARLIPILDANLADRGWVAGALSLADFAIATTFPYRDAVGFDLADTPRVAAWMRRMESRPSWQAATAPMRAFFAR